MGVEHSHIHSKKTCITPHKKLVWGAYSGKSHKRKSFSIVANALFEAEFLSAPTAQAVQMSSPLTWKGCGLAHFINKNIFGHTIMHGEMSACPREQSTRLPLMLASPSSGRCCDVAVCSLHAFVLPCLPSTLMRRLDEHQASAGVAYLPDLPSLAKHVCRLRYRSSFADHSPGNSD